MNNFVINKSGVYFHLDLIELGLDAEQLKAKGCQVLDTKEELTVAIKSILGEHIEFSDDEEEIIADALTINQKDGEYTIFSSCPMCIWDEEIDGDIYTYIANYEM